MQTRQQQQRLVGRDQHNYDRKQQLGSSTRKYQPHNDKFPNTLEGFGYAFNEKGELRHRDTGQPFQYYECNDDAYNQRRYTAVGKLVTEYIYFLLENEIRLKRVLIPTDKKPQSFFFMSQDALKNPDKLLILIHGSGSVRAGQWSRRLVINENLNSGSQLAFVARALSEGFAVIILNTNLHSATVQGKQEPVKFGFFNESTPEKHASYVWDHFVMKAKASQIAIIAHSYGGVVTTNLMTSKKDFVKRVYAVAFTDAVHRTPTNYEHRRFYHQNARNWVCSKAPVDTPLTGPKDDTPLVSAGTTEHERTSWNSMESVFTFLSQKYLAIEPMAVSLKKHKAT